MNSGASTMPTKTLAAAPESDGAADTEGFFQPEGEAPDYPGQGSAK